MGTSTLLDYALFQLTPTRTRCDLVLFYGGKTEKLASGLFEPFVSHLEFAKDQISKGGYSIKLCPPTTYAPWFTKATFERFVRFVSTPAVLERFVNLEKEIFHIESSNELSNTNVTAQREEGSRLGSNSNMRRLSNSSKVKGEVAISGDAAPEGNSKIQLQRLLETRKTLLRKEQAMAYARGLVAGFEIDNIDDLISFADAFGASRLREACTNFKELCKKKQGDGLWMEELAAMEACPPSELSFLGTSGIVLNNDGDLVSNGTLDASRSDSTTSYASSDSKKDDHSAMPDQMLSNNTKVKVAMPWPNQMPHYMYNFQNPIQQLPPYQGYPFPIPPHYATNMQWPPSLKESGPTKKEKSLNNKGFEHSGEDEKTESDDSEADSDSELYMRQNKGHSSKDSHRKKHRKKSSKTVVIRNINYITSKRRNGEKAGASDESSDEEDFIDEDSLRQQVDDAVGLLEKSHKSNLSNHKKRGSHKSNGISNGSNDVTAQDDPVEGGKKSENWDVLQNLLMRDEESNVNEVERSHPIDAQDQHYTVRDSGDGTALTNIAALDLESEKVPKQQMASDSFVVTERNGGFEERNRLEDIENAENLRSSLKRRDYTDGDLVIPQRMEDTGSGLRGILATESSIIKPGRGEDWFVINHSGQPENQNSTNEDLIFNGDSLNVEKSRKDVVVDDSFMVHAGPAVDNLYESQWRTDISMDADLTLPSKPENGTVKDSYEALGSHEPDDLCVVLERDSGFESARESWTTDHGIDILFMETDRRSSNGEISNGADKKLTPNCDSTIAKKEETKGRRVPGKEARPKVLPGFPRNNKIDAVSKSRKPSLANRPLVQKSKLEKEEEMRKKMEELSIQRQKRIAERTAAGGFAPAATKKTPLESKEVKGSTKFDKNKTHSNTQQTNKVSSTKIRAA
ncbi:COP1-interacting protein 7 isoform X2 [Ricinus communis]|uniref:COP1-interacting protein 7 isoform X2 n=1 Tax=Ricinus communis TaxID=3988 RepID=UPI00077262C0|nr:COP1-interacting protein 7 isoform X2 [Ricinus communis]|eukprot:XP_015574626.1 COP1-interacting protein 7 isoform X2 [Ricinus communis]